MSSSDRVEFSTRCLIDSHCFPYFSFPAVDCGSLAAPLNGSIQGNETTYPNTIHINCDSGFIRNGSPFRTCQANRTWSGVKTTCQGNDKPSFVTKRSQLLQSASSNSKDLVAQTGSSRRLQTTTWIIHS